MYPNLSNQLAKKDVNKSDAILIARFSTKQDYQKNIKPKLINNAKFMTHSKSN